MRQLIIIGTFIVILVSCDNADDAGSFINEDTKNYNDRINSGHLNKKQWAIDPIFIVRELFKSDDFERKVTIDLDGKSGNEITITLTDLEQPA